MEPSPAKRQRIGEPGETGEPGGAAAVPEEAPAAAAEPPPSGEPPAPAAHAVLAPAAEEEAGPSGRGAEQGLALRPRREGLHEKRKDEDKRQEEEQRAREVADRDRCLAQQVRVSLSHFRSLFACFSVGCQLLMLICLLAQEEAGELVFKVITNDGERQHMTWCVSCRECASGVCAMGYPISKRVSRKDEARAGQTQGRNICRRDVPLQFLCVQRSEEAAAAAAPALNALHITQAHRP